MLSAIASGLSGLLVPLSWYLPRELAFPLLLINTFVIAVTVLTYNITQVTARQRLCPEALLGRMNASIRFMVWGVMPIGSLIAGGLGELIGVVPTMTVGAIGGLFAVCFVFFGGKIEDEDAVHSGRRGLFVEFVEAVNVKRIEVGKKHQWDLRLGSDPVD